MTDHDDDQWPGLTGDQDGTVLGTIKQKLIDTKEQWARDGRGQSGEAAPAKGPDKPRLPPGQRLTQDFPVLDLGIQPPIAPDEWRLTVSGLVDNPIDWGWADFHDQPHVDIVTDIHCVTTWSRYDNRWQGISGPQFLSVVQPRADAKYMVFHAHDGYTTNVPVKVFNDDEVILAHTWNGEPISRAHGGPIRPIIPKLYLWKSAKWVKHITFLDKDAPGFWEVRGYHNDADPWKEERYG
ncbi:sulfite oxidase-like oxidoreductase [Magnetovibrio sp.]|uniref:sulfite oxidase-like oxidoreductase n=1 Tax=Magnetovibrio sp. TaxID=2024836 RepID=UPI002F9419C4